VQLSGSGVDPEGEGLTYTWVQTSGPSVVLDDAHAQAPSFDAPELLSNSDIVFELQVSDGTNTSVDTVTVTVNADNDAPSAEAGANQSVEENALVQLSGSGIDPEGEGLTFEWVQVSGTPVQLDDASAASPSFEAPEGLVDSEIRFELKTSDGVNISVDSVTITVHADDDAPIDVDAGENQVIDEREVVQLSGGAIELEGQDLTYEWVQTSGTLVALDDASAQNPTFRAPEGLVNSDISFELRVSDGLNEVMDDVTITVRADNDVPTASAGDSYGVEEGQFASLSGVGLDPEGQGLSYEWVQVSGPIVQLDDPQDFETSFLTPNEVSNTDIVFELHVSDGVNTSVDTITITVEADDDAPTANAGNDSTVRAGSTVVLSGSGTDPEDVGLIYSWVQTEGPQVVLFNADSETPSFGAPEGVGGTLVFEIRVSDGVNTSVDTVRIVVLEGPAIDGPQDGEPVLADPESSEPFRDLSEALLTVNPDVEEGPLKELIGQVLHIADAPDAPDVRADLLDLLAPIVEGKEFSQVFDTNTELRDPVDEAPSLLGLEPDGRSSERTLDEDQVSEGFGEPDSGETEKPTNAIAKFFGLVRGLAGTSDKADSTNSERKNKDIQRRD
jgi:hypothetical protein